MSSERLPGKVLMEIGDRPLLGLLFDRLKLCNSLDEIAVATSTNPADDQIVQFANSENIRCYRGAENDVLKRVTEAVKEFDAELHVEFMADNPMPDPKMVDDMVGTYLENQNDIDYLTNCLTTTYPSGFEVMVYPAKTLIAAEDESTFDHLREHVGLHIYKRPERFRIMNIEAPPSQHAPSVHMEVDTEEDFYAVQTVFDHFLPDNPDFSLDDVLDFLKTNPEVAQSNAEVPRRWEQFRL